MKDDGTFHLEAFSNINEQLKSGSWDLYGDVLVMRSEKCLDTTCQIIIMGVVEDFEKDKGFTFKHSGTDSPAMPTEWVVQKYED